MAWVRIDDAMPRHPKLVQAGPLAGWLFVTALCYSNQYTTDGFIPDEVLPVLSSIPDVEAIAERLVRSNLFHRVEGGYLIHDYLEFQPSSEKIRAARENAKERMSRSRSQEVLKKFSRTSDNIQRSSEEVIEKLHYPNPTQPNPIPTRRRSVNTPPENEESGFAEFWSEYPLKKAKATARTAWSRRRFSDDEVRLVMSSLRKQKETWNDPRYIPHAATWINQERWQDEVVISPPAKGAGNPFVTMLEEEYREQTRDHETAGDHPLPLPEDGVY